MSFTLVAQSFAWLVTFLAVLLDHFWMDRRTRRFKMGRHALLVVVAVAAVVGVTASWLSEQRQESQRRETTKRMLSHVERELGYNFSVLQLKSGQTFALSDGPNGDKDQRWLSLELITSQPFHASVPVTWGNDLRRVALSGRAGSQLFDLLTHFYSELDGLQERERELLQKVRDAENEDRQGFYVRALHDEYDTFRALLQKTWGAAVPVFEEFGLANGEGPEKPRPNPAAEPDGSAAG